MELKTCQDCEIEKPIDDFDTIKRIDKSYKLNFCKKCAWLRRKKKGYQTYHQKHPEKWNAYQKAYKKKKYNESK